MTQIAMNYWEAPIADAATIVLVHGGGESASSFLRVATRLSGMFRVIVPDLPGHGDSDWLSEGRYLRDTMVDLLADFIDNVVGPRSAAFVGQSLGARIALGVAAARPDLVNSLTMIDTAPETAKSGREALAQTMSLRPFPDLEFAARTLGLVSGETATSDELDRARRHTRVLEDNRVDLKFDPYFSAMVQEPALIEATRGTPAEIRRDAKRVGVPTLIVRGSNSELVSEIAAMEFSTLFDQGYLHTVRDAGHLVNRDNPAGLSDALGWFHHRDHQ